MPGKMPRPSGAWQSPSSTRWCGGMAVMSLPSNTTEPDVTGRTPDTVLSVVVLPAPFAPMSVTISPSATSKLMPLIASIRP